MAKTVICHVVIVGNEKVVTLIMGPVMMDVRQVIWVFSAGHVSGSCFVYFFVYLPFYYL